MDFSLSTEQVLFRDTLDRFLGDHGAQARATGTAEERTFIWTSLADLGCFGISIPEAEGGLGGDAIDIGTMMDMMGRHRVPAPVLCGALVSGALVSRVANPAQRSALLPGLMTGERRFALANLDMPGQTTTAVRSGKGWRVTGAKQMVVGGAEADVILISATLDAGFETGLFLVERTADGLTEDAYETIDGGRATDLRLDMDLPDASLLGETGDRASDLAWAIDLGTMGLCWDAVGAMTAAFEQTANYVSQRVQFGRPIASFQVVQHKLAEMAVCCEEARASALLAALSIDDDDRRRVRAVSSAKAKVGTCADRVAKDAVQLHGGMGVSDELPIAGYFRRLFAFERQFGSTADHIDRYARTIVADRSHRESVILQSLDQDIAG